MLFEPLRAHKKKSPPLWRIFCCIFTCHCEERSCSLRRSNLPIFRRLLRYRPQPPAMEAMTLLDKNCAGEFSRAVALFVLVHFIQIFEFLFIESQEVKLL